MFAAALACVPNAWNSAGMDRPTLRAVWLLIGLGLGAVPAQAQNCAYVAVTSRGAIAVLDLDGADFAGWIPVGSQPLAVAVRPGVREAYVVNDEDADVSVVDLAQGADVARISVGYNPTDVTFDAAGAYAYVANLRGNSLSVIDANLRQAVATIRVGAEGPAAVALSADERIAYTANLFADSVSVIDIEQRRVVRHIAVGGRPFDLALTPDGRELLVLNSEPGTISVVSTETHSVVATVTVADHLYGIAVRPQGDLALVTDGDGGKVHVVDVSSRQVTGTVEVEPGAFSDVAFSFDGLTAYVSEFVFGNVFEIDVVERRSPRFLTVGGGSTLQRMALAEIDGRCLGRRPDCVGDCDGDGRVTVDEIVRGVAIALGSSGVEMCPASDANGDGSVTVDEILAAVSRALVGCAAAEVAPDEEGTSEFKVGGGH